MISDTLFESNEIKSSTVNGILKVTNSNNIIQNCVFRDNAVNGDCAGIFISGKGYSYTIAGCEFESCKGASGSAVRVDSRDTDVKLTLDSCVFINNTSSDGAVYSTKELTVKNCQFVNNTSTANAGAIRAEVLTVISSTFQGNTASGNGGAIFISSSSSQALKILDDKTIFSGNIASKGGAIYISKNTGAILSGCSFVGNQAIYDGGAIYNLGSLVAEGVSFSKNICTSEEDSRGGTIFSQGNLSLSDIENFVGDNTKTISYGGAIYLTSESLTKYSFYINNVKFGNFKANNGGVLYMNDGYLKLNNCSFGSTSDNIANSAISKGGVLYINCASSSVDVFDCQFQNATATNGAFVYTEGSFSSDIITFNSTTFSDATGTALYLVGGKVYLHDVEVSSSSEANVILNGAYLYLSGLINIYDDGEGKTNVKHENGYIFLIGPLSKGSKIGLSADTDKRVVQAQNLSQNKYYMNAGDVQCFVPDSNSNIALSCSFPKEVETGAIFATVISNTTTTIVVMIRLTFLKEISKNCHIHWCKSIKMAQN